MPFLNSCRPVISALRVGEHVGLTWKSEKLLLSPRSLSKLGVFKTGFPWADISPNPWSSVRMKTMLGCLSGKMAAKLPVTMKIEADRSCRRAFSINDRFEGSARARIRRGGAAYLAWVRSLLPAKSSEYWAAFLPKDARGRHLAFLVNALGDPFWSCCKLIKSESSLR